MLTVSEFLSVLCNRDSSHRKATLRNLVTNLIKHESIVTTHAKAKEAQSAADRLIKLAKSRSPNLEAAKVRAEQYIYVSYSKYNYGNHDKLNTN